MDGTGTALPLTVARANSGTPRPSLPGPHQIENAALALETMKQLNALPESALIERALKSVQWPGRFERIGTPPLVLDGAHNEHAARVLTATWNEEFPGQKGGPGLAAAADKQIRDMIPVFRKLRENGTWCPVHPRASCLRKTWSPC